MSQILLSALSCVFITVGCTMLQGQVLDSVKIQQHCKENQDPQMPYLPCLAMNYYHEAEEIMDNSTWNEDEKQKLVLATLEQGLNYAQQALFVNPNYALNHLYHIKLKLALDMPQDALKAIMIYLDLSIDNKHVWINNANAMQEFTENDILTCLNSESRYFQEFYYKDYPNWVEDLHAYLLEFYPHSPFTYNLIGEYKRFFKSDEKSATYYFKMAEKKTVSVSE